MFLTHLVFAFLISLLTFKFFNDGFVFILFVLIGSLLPDIDSPVSKFGSRIRPLSNFINLFFGHRGVLHSLFPLFLIFFLISRTTIAYALIIGYLSHLVADALTVEGIYLFYPVSKFRIKGFVKVNSLMEHLFFILILFFVFLRINYLF